MKKLFMIVLLAGLGLGGGAVFALELMDSSMRRPSDFEEHLGLPVLAAVTWIDSSADRARRNLNRALTGGSVLTALTLTGVMAWMAAYRVDPAVELLGHT